MKAKSSHAKKRPAPKRKAAKRAKVTKLSAKVAAKKAGKRHPVNDRERPATWSKGGRDWARVLGRFGVTPMMGR
jgi:hypothetical protein